jgi:hypothetical protein
MVPKLTSPQMQYLFSSGPIVSSGSSAALPFADFLRFLRPALRFTTLILACPSSPAVTVPDGGGRRRGRLLLRATGTLATGEAAGRLTLLARRNSRVLTVGTAGGSALAALGVSTPREERGRCAMALATSSGAGEFACFGATDARRGREIAAVGCTWGAGGAAGFLFSVGDGSAGVGFRLEGLDVVLSPTDGVGGPAGASGTWVVVVLMVGEDTATGVCGICGDGATTGGMILIRLGPVVLGILSCDTIEASRVSVTGVPGGVASRLRLFAGLATSFLLVESGVTVTLSPVPGKRFFILVPATMIWRLASSISMASRRACSRSRLSLLSFLASFNFIPRFTSCESSAPQVSCAISPGARGCPCLLIRSSISSSSKGSPVSSASFFAAS